MSDNYSYYLHIKTVTGDTLTFEVKEEETKGGFSYDICKTVAQKGHDGVDVDGIRRAVPHHGVAHCWIQMIED